MTGSRWVWLAAGVVALAGCEPTGGEGTTVAPEPAGKNCAQGGVRITGDDGAVEYACNGTPGDATAIADEPPGAHCTHGGLRITDGDGKVSYLCASQVSDGRAALCPGGVAGAASSTRPGLFMTLRGGSSIPGTATAPAASGRPALDDALRLEALCHGMQWEPPGGQSNGGVYLEPLTVVLRVDQTLPLLMTAFAQARLLEVGLRVYGEDGVGLGEDVIDAEVTLDNAHLVLVEQFTAQDPVRPHERGLFVRLGFIYNTWEYETFGPSGTVVSDSQRLFLPLAPQAPCVPVFAEAGDSLTATARVDGQALSGAASWETFAACLRAERGYAGNMLTGSVTWGPLELFKRQDGQSPLLQAALFGNDLVDGRLELWRRVDPGVGSVAREVVFEEETLNGRLSGYGLLLQGDTRLERLRFDYTGLRQTWLEGGQQFEVDLADP